jgi:hypothetical protein
MIDISKIITSLIVAGVSWLVYTTVETKEHIKLIEYKLEQNNKILQDLYETKANYK